MSFIIDNMSNQHTLIPQLSNRLASSQQIILAINRKLNLRPVKVKIKNTEKESAVAKINVANDSVLLKVQTDRTGSLQLNLSCLHNERYQRLVENKQKIQLSKLICKAQVDQADLTYTLVEHHGRLIMKIPLVEPLVNWYNQRAVAQFCHSMVILNIRKLYYFLDKSELKARNSENQKQLNNRFEISRILSQVSLNFEDYEQHTQEQDVQIQKLEENDISKVIQSIVQNDGMEKLSVDLMGQAPKNQNLINTIREETEEFREYYSGSIEENKAIQDYVYNTCDLEIVKMLDRPIAEGGSSQLYLAKVRLSLVNSVDFLRYDKSKPAKDATLAVKKIKSDIEHTLGYKLTHEKDIVRRLKGSYSMFLPKFYGTSKQSKTSNQLFMEMVLGEQLDPFLQNRALTTSLETKALLLFNLVLGMRTLVDYKVTHLDFKPANVIVTRFLIPKIIDFGEAYHPEVCKDDYTPGYSFPYVAPEVYKKIKNYPTKFNYSEKQDVFSFGVMMYEVLFDNRLFSCSFSKFHELFLEGEPLSTVFQCPENFEGGTYSIFFKSLLSLIEKCVDPNPENRPKFDWLGITLKIMLDQSLFI